MATIDEKYAQLGGRSGFLGEATSLLIPTADGGQRQEFRGGMIYWQPQIGAFEVHGAILGLYLNLNSDQSFLGYPTTDETPTQDGVGRFNHFEHGTIYWHPATGAHEVHGLIRARWQALGSESSKLGYPMTSETATPDGEGRYNHFQHGSIYWKPTTGAVEVDGAVRKRWAELRWERGLLGYPVKAPVEEMRGQIKFIVADFEGGRMEVNLSTQHVHVQKFASISSPNYEIPITAYRVSDNDGGRPCNITAAGVQQWLNDANEVFAAAGVRFTYDGQLHDLLDTEVNNLTGDRDSFWESTRDRLSRLAAQHRSIVIIHRFGPGENSIGGGFSWWTYDFVAMSYFDALNLRVLAHELGHHFGLPHTHGLEFKSVSEAEEYVLSGGLIENLDGDRSLINDTAPDPYIVALNPLTSIRAVNLGGQAFSLDRKNIMSYWEPSNPGQLSHSQIDRVRQIVSERRSRYLNVTEVVGVDCNTLNAEIAALQVQLQQAITRLAVEQDPLMRSTLAYTIVMLPAKIMSLTVIAQEQGCI